MPIEYHFDAESNIMHLTASGSTAQKEWMGVFLEIKEFEMLVEAKNIKIRVFADVDEGRRWLREDEGN